MQDLIIFFFGSVKMSKNLNDWFWHFFHQPFFPLGCNMWKKNCVEDPNYSEVPKILDFPFQFITKLGYVLL